MQNFDYSFNINGNYMPNIKGMNEATSQFATKTKEATGFVTAFANKLAVFDLATGFVEKFIICCPFAQQIGLISSYAVCRASNLQAK